MIDFVAGVTAIDKRVAGFTVKLVEPDIAPEVAVITVVDIADTSLAVASPSVPVALEIVATEVLEEDQVTVAVRSAVDPLSYVPVAVNCLVNSSITEGFEGVTLMETSVAGFTVRVVELETAPDAAVIVVVETAETSPAVASPSEPPALEMDAAETLDDDHVTELVMFAVAPLSYVPVAVNCLVKSSMTEGFDGVMLMETRVAGFTVRTVESETIPETAVIVVVAVAAISFVVASPSVPSALEMVAADVLEDAQVTEVVRSAVDPLSYVPVAVNCLVKSSIVVGLTGVMLMD